MLSDEEAQEVKRLLTPAQTPDILPDSEASEWPSESGVMHNKSATLDDSVVSSQLWSQSGSEANLAESESSMVETEGDSETSLLVDYPPKSCQEVCLFHYSILLEVVIMGFFTFLVSFAGTCREGGALL